MACDVLLEFPRGVRPVGAVFTKRARGVELRRLPQVAATFYWIGRAPGDAAAVRWELAGSKEEQPAVVDATCYDADGKQLKDDEVRLAWIE